MSEPERPDLVTPGELVPSDPDQAPGMPDLGGLLGGLDLDGLLGAAQSMQVQLAEAQERIASTVVEGQSGGGVVRIAATGDLTFTAVHIDPEAFDPDDPSMLEDLVLAALHDVATQVAELQADASPGLDLGGLGGLLGGG
ncbi:MAG TPA: YbaB/EbfC family nucleoid-associated protein [Microthrixaceae bacterium]|nr:YbaB/EbfC family nucleoid-associated protein [Microthrixaceae bacterium]